MITDMIAKLEDEAHAQAGHKEYCDTELQASKEEVATLQKTIGEISRQTVEMDLARSDEHAVFLEAKTDLEQGIKALQNALTLLRDYYASGPSVEDASLLEEASLQPAVPTTHSAAGGAGAGVISMLEVAESDFAKSLAEKTMMEESSESDYEKVSHENEITKSMKEQDVKYKTSEAKSLDRKIAEETSELETKHTELGAVLEYSDKLDSMCIAKPESYEDRKARRTAEIEGLREALTYLDSGVMLQRAKQHHGSMLQRSKRHFRGSK